MKNADGTRKYRAMHFWLSHQAGRQVAVMRRAHWYNAQGSLQNHSGGASTGWDLHAGRLLFPFLLPGMIARVSLKRLQPTEHPQGGGETGLSYAIECVALKMGDGVGFGPLHGVDRGGAPSMAKKIAALPAGDDDHCSVNRNIVSICDANMDIWSLMWPEAERHMSRKNWLVYRMGVKVYRKIWDEGREREPGAQRWPRYKGSNAMASLLLMFERAGDPQWRSRSQFSIQLRDDVAREQAQSKHNRMLSTMDDIHARRLLV